MAGRSWTHVDGEWRDGNPMIMGPMTHASWLASVVFDGARAFDGCAPDLDMHCRRIIDSARALGLNPPTDADTLLGLAREGIARFDAGTALYVRPMIWAETGFVDPDPDSARFCMTVYESPMPDTHGSACLVSKRRPGPEVAPTLAKAACLYPQSAVAMREAKTRGFANAIMLDPLGAVSEFATANIFLARDGVVATPVPNGTFLNGVTRRRVIELLRADGVTVEERRVSPDEVAQADEVFSTGNYAKVQAYTRVGDRDLQPGPIYARARALYWDYARSHRV
ncbi:MAG: branched-chain amino acid aminotransferase [Azospirillaceae bacterium]